MIRPIFSASPSSPPSQPRFAGETFHAQVDSHEREISRELTKWAKRASTSQSGHNPTVRQIAQNIIDAIRQGDLAGKGLKLITARNEKGKVKAVCLLEFPPNKPYAILQDLVNANKPNAKGSGKTALQMAKTVTQAHSRGPLLLYSHDEGTVDFYQRQHGFQFIKTVPDFPNGIWGLDVNA